MAKLIRSIFRRRKPSAEGLPCQLPRLPYLHSYLTSANGPRRYTASSF